MTILLVDDDEDDRKLFSDAAAEVDNSIKCVAAAGGKEALDYLSDEANPAPDFIFLDLRMPVISGQECLEKIKRDIRLASVPVIIYTTSRNVRESQELKKLGAAHFVSKPASARDAYYMVSFVLGEKWS